MFPLVEIIASPPVSFQKLSLRKFQEDTVHLLRLNCFFKKILFSFPPQICTYLATTQHMTTSVSSCAVPVIRSSSPRSSSRTAVSGLLHREHICSRCSEDRPLLWGFPTGSGPVSVLAEGCG